MSDLPTYVPVRSLLAIAKFLVLDITYNQTLKTMYMAKQHVCLNTKMTMKLTYTGVNYYFVGSFISSCRQMSPSAVFVPDVTTLRDRFPGATHVRQVSCIFIFGYSHIRPHPMERQTYINVFGSQSYLILPTSYSVYYSTTRRCIV